MVELRAAVNDAVQAENKIDAVHRAGSFPESMYRPSEIIIALHRCENRVL